MNKYYYREAGGPRTATLIAPPGYTKPLQAISFVEAGTDRLVTFILEEAGTDRLVTFILEEEEGNADDR